MAFAGVRAIAFDFDGVIVDSMPVHWACWREALDAVLGSESGRVGEGIRRNLFGGHAGHDMFEGIDVAPDARRALRAHKDSLWEARAAGVPLMADTADVLTGLMRHFPLAIATTARRGFVSAILSRESLSHMFAAVVTKADVTNPKPAPDMLETISRDLGIPASEIAMAVDRRMAETAGCPFLWFEPNALARPTDDDGHPVVADWPALARIFGGGRP